VLLEAQKGPHVPIPNHPFDEESAGIMQAYYQAPLALYKLGQQLGQDRLLAFLLSVYQANRNPTFDDFDRRFAADFPKHLTLWRQLWQLDL